MGKLDSGDVKGNRQGRLQFKFYPEGKSKSDEHLGAEGWFTSHLKAGNRIGISNSRCRKIERTPRSSFRTVITLSLMFLSHIHSLAGLT